MPSPDPVRLSTAEQLVAAVPLHLGYVPTESLVVVCQHEPRGRFGLTMRFDLPRVEDEEWLIADAVRRVRRQRPSRLLLVLYTDEPDPRDDLVGGILDELEGELEVTDALLVHHERFLSYLCGDPRCCPPQGRPVDVAADDEQVRRFAAEQVVRGHAVMSDRAALAQSLAGPTFLAAEEATQRCIEASRTDFDADDLWAEVIARFQAPPAVLSSEEAARLAVSLDDVLLRDTILTAHEPERLRPVLAELCRRTPAPYDVAVCTCYAWVAYLEGGGAELTIALERALASDPSYSLANLIRRALDGQTPPELVRQVTSQARGATRTARRSRRSRGSRS